MSRAVQVTWYQTPDRAVLSFVNISTPGGAPSSWQVSLAPLMAWHASQGANFMHDMDLMGWESRASRRLWPMSL